VNQLVYTCTQLISEIVS